jgi:hypothetical protein
MSMARSSKLLGDLVMVAALRTLIKLELEIGLGFGVERGTLHATDAAGELFPELPPFI